MMRRVAVGVLLLLAACVPGVLAGQAPSSSALPSAAPKGLRAGHVGCVSPEALERQEQLLEAEGVRSWQGWLEANRPLCTLMGATDAGAVSVSTVPGDDGEPRNYRGREIVCVRNPSWAGCRYLFREALWEISGG